MPYKKPESLGKNSLSILFSNLAKASEKQQKKRIYSAYSALAEEYRESSVKGDLKEISNSLSKTLEEDYPLLQTEAQSAGDRGAQRAYLWGQKVTTLQRSLIDRYLSKGEELLAGKDLFVCEACGFIFLGSEVPAMCPVCKAPSSRFSKI